MSKFSFRIFERMMYSVTRHFLFRQICVVVTKTYEVHGRDIAEDDDVDGEPEYDEEEQPLGNHHRHNCWQRMFIPRYPDCVGVDASVSRRSDDKKNAQDNDPSRNRVYSEDVTGKHEDSDDESNGTVENSNFFRSLYPPQSRQTIAPLLLPLIHFQTLCPMMAKPHLGQGTESIPRRSCSQITSCPRSKGPFQR